MKDKENKNNGQEKNSEIPLTNEHGAEAAADAKTGNGDLAAKLDELNNKYTRLYADFDNFRRRTAKERIEWLKTAGEDTILGLLPALDDMERAVAHNKNVEDSAALREGMEIICQKFKNLIAARGVEQMETVGKPFDPELHDAVTSLEAKSEDMKGKVIEEVQKGYLLNGKVIRHAKVVVGK